MVSIFSKNSTTPFCTMLAAVVAINKELHNVQFFFIANLMICDIISSFTMNSMITGITLNSLNDSKSKGTNYKMVDTLYFPFTTSFIMVTVLIFNRFLIIVFRFSYHKIMTNKVIMGFVAGSWLIGFILCSFAHMRESTQEIDSVTPTQYLADS